MRITPARAAALEVVRRVRERDAYAHAVLDSVLTDAPLPPDEAGLATRLAYGSIQMQGTLDEAIDRFAHRPGDIRPRVRDALRISAYELLFSRAPARAAVHQGVELVKSVRQDAGPFANAVLRKLAEAAAGFPWGDPAVDDAALAREYGHPAWLTQALIAEFGRRNALDVLAADNGPAPFYLAHNPFVGPLEMAVDALLHEGAQPGPGPIPGSIVCGDPARAVASSALRDGIVIVADAAAQLAPAAIGSHPNGVVVDLAAGRGTKTALLQIHAAAAGATAHVYAVDIHSFKTAVLQDRMRALEVPDVTALTGDATRPESIAGLPPAGGADAVLVDAPCSGLGTLRRHPEMRWRVAEADIARLAALGAGLLHTAASLVRPGGVVVYSTCTFTRTENADAVQGFLGSEEGSGFRLRRLDPVVPEGWRDFVAPEGWFQSLPAPGGPDGHFVAALERVR